MVTSSTIPSSVLSKRSSALNYHRVREAIAAKVIRFHHVPGKSNPADILSKHFAYADVRPLLEPIMFWKGVGPEYTEHLDVSPKSEVKSNLQDKGEYQKSKSSGLAKSRKLKLD